MRKVTQLARKCGLPSCNEISLHRGGYCCREHKAEHKRLIHLRDNPPPVRVAWTCPNAIGAPYWQSMDSFESDECGFKFETTEDRDAVAEGLRLAICPRCKGEVEAYYSSVITP